jgi:phage terminase small subunit
MSKAKDEAFLKGKRLGGRPAVVEARITAPVKPHKQKVLTTQEWQFVEEFCAGDGHVTLKEAALRAGYSDTWARNRARELTDPDRNPHIVAAIQERRRELGEKYGTTFERHMRDLQVIRDQALQAGAYGAAVQAEYRRGQALGTIYIERKEIRHGTIDSMSREEVMRKLEEIKKLYGGGNGGPIIDITPVQIEQDPEIEDVPAAEDVSEEESDGDKTGSSVIQEAERQPTKLPFHPD